MNRVFRFDGKKFEKVVLHFGGDKTGVSELYWTDVACGFRVNRAQTKTSVGYVDVPATITLI
jgi:hypothetical protein